MNNLPDFSAVILDMDGLVLDTEVTYFKAWQQAAQKMGFELPEQFCRSLSGLNYQSVEQKLLDYFGAPFQLERFRSVSGECWSQTVRQHGIGVRDGFFQLLEIISERQLTYCLATNSHEINALECLELAGLSGVFEIMITRDQVAKGKPEPDIFYQAAALMNKPIDRCLAVEDSPTGIAAAKNAGAYAILIPYVLPVPAETAALSDLMLNDLSELAEKIRAKFLQQSTDHV